MATYSHDPRRYVGPERLLLEAIYKLDTNPSPSGQRIDLPVPTKHAGLTLRARLWGLVKAAEGLTNPTNATKYGIPSEEAAHLITMAASARKFTSALHQPNPEEPAHILTFLPIVDTDNYAGAVDTLTTILTQGE